MISVARVQLITNETKPQCAGCFTKAHKFADAQNESFSACVKFCAFVIRPVEMRSPKGTIFITEGGATAWHVHTSRDLA